MAETAKIIPYAEPPSEFPLYFHEGIVSTEYGNILVTDVNLNATLELFQRRGRSIYGDFEHRSSEPGSGDEKLSPFHIGNLEVRSGMLFASKVQWTRQGASVVSDGSFLYTSLELRDSTNLEWDEKLNCWTIEGPLDIKSVALTRDPAVHGATPIRPDVKFSASRGKAKPNQWRFSMPVDPKEPMKCDAESAESSRLDAVNQVIDAALASSNDPEEVKKYLTNLKSLISEMVDSQEAEVAAAPAPTAQSAEPPKEAPKMSAEETKDAKEAKEAYAILTKHFGKLSMPKLEARLFSLAQAKKSLPVVKADLAKQELDQKRDLLKLSIERTLVSPMDKKAQEDFLGMSLAACKEFADSEGIKHQFSIPDMSKFEQNPMPQPNDKPQKARYFSAKPVRG